MHIMVLADFIPPARPIWEECESKMDVRMITVSSQTIAIKAQRMLRKNGIRCKIVRPSPRQTPPWMRLWSSCGCIFRRCGDGFSGSCRYPIRGCGRMITQARCSHLSEVDGGFHLRFHQQETHLLLRKQCDEMQRLAALMTTGASPY